MNNIGNIIDAYNGGTFTLLVDENGKPMLWEDQNGYQNIK